VWSLFPIDIVSSMKAVMTAQPEIGDVAPDFEGSTSKGATIRLKDYLGKKNVVLYFYPRDDTRGCTIEACSFRDKLNSLRALWTEVVGVSVDSLESHRQFTEKNNLNFPLVSDRDKRISQMYGALSEDGSKAERITFIIDRHGRIAKVFTEVDVTKHTDEVVAVIKQLPHKKANRQ
jgi:peroxiredoxin Q/BCP